MVYRECCGPKTKWLGSLGLKSKADQQLFCFMLYNTSVVAASSQQGQQRLERKGFCQVISVRLLLLYFPQCKKIKLRVVLKQHEINQWRNTHLVDASREKKMLDKKKGKSYINIVKFNFFFLHSLFFYLHSSFILFHFISIHHSSGSPPHTEDTFPS